MDLYLFNCFSMLHHDPVLKHLIWDLFGQMLHFWHLLNLASETEELIEVLDDSERQPSHKKNVSEISNIYLPNIKKTLLHHIYII